MNLLNMTYNDQIPKFYMKLNRGIFSSKTFEIWRFISLGKKVRIIDVTLQFNIFTLFIARATKKMNTI